MHSTYYICQNGTFWGGVDEGTEGWLRTEQKLTPRSPPQPWEVLDVRQALLAALKDREIVNL